MNISLSRRRLGLVAATATGLVLVGGVAVVHAATTSNPTASCTSAPTVTQVQSGSQISVTCTVPNPPAATATATATVTKTVTASPAPSSPSTSTSTTAPSSPTSSSSTPTTSTSSSPTSTTSAAPSGSTAGFPDASTTGVPAGTTLTSYSGPCTITQANTVLNKVDATSCGMLFIHAPGVKITDSRVPVVNATDITDPSKANVTISYSDAVGADWSDGVLWGFNITADHVNVTGGQHSFHCNDNCTLTNSYLHDQYNPAGGSTHNNAFISNGGSNMVVRHNTLWCSVTLNSTNGGCTADVSLFGDFGPISNVTIDNNLLKANNSSISYCAYGGDSTSKPYPHADHVSFTNNVFERGANNKCGVFGPVTSFNPSGTGNVWSGNVWSDGSTVPSAN